MGSGKGTPRSLEQALREDDLARQRILTSLDESLLVEAAAGTGKTTVLVERLVAMLGTGRARVEGFVAVTFTRKAAGELKLRLRQSLDEAREHSQDPVEAENLGRAIAHLEEAQIGTIHSFCAEVLREYPVEAKIDPEFQELDESSGPTLYDLAFDRFMEERLESMPKGLRRALSRLALDNRYTPNGQLLSALERLRDAGRGLIDWRDYDAPWKRDAFETEREWAITELVERVERLAENLALGAARDPLVRALEPVALLAQWIGRSEALKLRDFDQLEARLISLRSQLRYAKEKRGRGKFAEAVPRRMILEARDRLLVQIDSFAEAANADLAASLHEELSSVIDAYEALKQERGCLDFQDLLIRCRDLVRDDAVVRKELKARFTHIFVDEFQDTDPVQTELLLLLSSAEDTTDFWQVRPESGKLFLVGDPKQSIYRFRRADIALYERVKTQLESAGVGVVYLQRSYRALPGIQKLINRAFEPVMDGDTERGNPAYIPLLPARSEISHQPSAVVLPVPRPFSPWGRLTKKAIDESQPVATAGFVKALLESDFRVEEPGRGIVPIEPRHVCLLFRRFMNFGNDVTRPYTRALEALGVSHLLVGSRTYHRREEVETLRTALQAIEWPDDELAVFATLRGSLFAFSDEVLLQFRLTYGRLHPFRAKHLQEEGLDQETELSELVQALGFLGELHRQRNWRAIVQTVQALLSETRAWAGFALRPAGQQVLANVERVCELARRYELGGGRSFRGFVERLALEAKKPATSDSGFFEEGAQGVRLMTVHAAKGLEFPVVILADMTANLAPRDASRTVDEARGLCAQRLLQLKPLELLEREKVELRHERAEGERVAYVASTRARDLLVVPAIGAKQRDGWLASLGRAVYPFPLERDPDPALARDLGDILPEFGPYSLEKWPARVDQESRDWVRPGCFQFPRDGALKGGDQVANAPQSDHDESYTVVWWDPNQLPAVPEANFGLKQTEILIDKEAVAQSGESPELERGGENLRRYQAWRASHDQAIARGSKPRFESVSVTELAEQGELAPASKMNAVEILRIEGTEQPRVGGARFGSLVHAVLRDVPLDADRAVLQAASKMHGRLLDASKEEVAACPPLLERTLEHPLLQAAARLPPSRVRREAQVFFRDRDQRLIEGVIDLALHLQEDDGGDPQWCIVDFKTNDPDELLADEERLESYRCQLGWYAHALEGVVGSPVRSILMVLSSGTS